MKLPNHQNAFIDDTKLVGYCLNKLHDVGKHKAVVFEPELNITAENYLLLKIDIFRAIASNDCEEGYQMNYGKLFVVDFKMTSFGK